MQNPLQLQFQIAGYAEVGNWKGKSRRKRKREEQEGRARKYWLNAKSTVFLNVDGTMISCYGSIFIVLSLLCCIPSQAKGFERPGQKKSRMLNRLRTEYECQGSQEPRVSRVKSIKSQEYQVSRVRMLQKAAKR